MTKEWLGLLIAEINEVISLYRWIYSGFVLDMIYWKLKQLYP